MSDLQSFWAAEAWRRMVENRRRRDRTRRLLLLGSISVSIVLISAAIANGGRLARAAPFVVHGIEVSNNRAVDAEAVASILGIRPGDPWWKLAPRSIGRRVAEHPRIARLEIRYLWFHRLGVDVSEREPVLAVLGPISGELTGDGWILRDRGPGRSRPAVDLPVLRCAPGGWEGAGDRAGPRAAAVARLVARIRDARPALWRDLSEIELREEGARAYLRSVRGVVLFDPGRHEELWEQVPTVLQDLDRLGCDDVVLDLRFSGRIVARFAEGGGPDSVPDWRPSEKV